MTRRTLDLADCSIAISFQSLCAEATAEDGQPPFSDQTLVEVSAGVRTAFEVSDAPDGAVGGDTASTAVAVVTTVVADGQTPREAELVVRPSARRRGLGTRLLEQLTADGGELLVWAHGDHPAARVLADRFHFAPVRELLQLRLDLTDSGDRNAPARTDQGPPSPREDVRIDSFRPGIDDEAWLESNAAAFADHPEQGRLTQRDLHARVAESWFDPDDFLIARGEDDRMLGFCWLKVERDPDQSIGEFYAVGVSPAAQRLGLGRSLMDAGLARLRRTGIRVASLYVDADNTAAVALYRSMGFSAHTIDVQYRRAAPV